MSKRRLSKQQQLRIAEKQKKEVNSVEQRGDSAPAIRNKCNGRVISHFGRQLEVESLRPEDRGHVLRCHQRTNLPPLVTGDLVVWEQDSNASGVIVAAEQRRSLFVRPDTTGKPKPVAANIDVVLVVFAVIPEAFMNLIDRYLVAIEGLGLQALLVLNKIDLLKGLSEADRGSLDNMLTIYGKLDYRVFQVSTETGAGISELEAALNGKTTVLVGQSGVGKSSLVNRLGLRDVAGVGELSRGKSKGTHKTSTARLFHLKHCDLIDSPGIREFHLGHVSPQELLAGFREMREPASHCNFRDCSHQREPGCAIQAALANGRINQERLDSYFRILNSIENP